MLFTNKHIMIRKLRLEIKWAIIFSIVSITWFLVEKFLGFHDKNINKQLAFSYVFIIPAILVYVLAIRQKKKNVFNGTMTWKQGTVSGIYISFFVAVLSLMINYICLEYVSPNYLTNMAEYVVKSKVMTPSDAANYFNIKSYLLEGVSGALSIGVVTSAIVAFFLQTKN